MATVSIKNVDRLIQRFNQVANMDLKDTMVKAVTLVHGEAKSLAPVDTGNLAGSIHMEVKANKRKLEGRVFTNLEYAPYVEFGTGSKGNGTYPHKVKGLKLSYKDDPWVYTPDGGETFYYTEGQVAQPYMYPALKNNEKKIKKLFQDSISQQLAKNCKGGQ